MLKPAGTRFGAQFQYLGGEAGTKILVDADAPPLRGGLLAAQMRGGFAGVAGAFEVEVQLQVVLGVQVAAAGVEAGDVVRGHAIGTEDVQVDRPAFARAVQLDEEDRLPAAQQQRAVRHRDGLRRVHEQPQQVGMRVVAVVHGGEIVQVVAVARHQALEVGDHVALKLRLAFVDIDPGGCVRRDQG